MNSIQEIIGDVACATGVPAPAITGSTKTRPVVSARYLAIAAIRLAFPCYSQAIIALAFERTCPSTITKALQRYCNLYEKNREFRTIARELNLPPFLT
jgi:chromosomal replication initiation ATPase DnaA